MSEKESSWEQTGVEVTDAAIVSIAAKAIKEVEGVADLASRFYDDMVDSISTKLGQRHQNGISLKKQKDKSELNLYIYVYYGYKVVEVAYQVQQAVTDALGLMLDVKDMKVNVFVESLKLKNEGKDKE